MQSFSKTKLKFKMCSYKKMIQTVEKKSSQQNIYSSKSLIDLFSPGG